MRVVRAVVDEVVGLFVSDWTQTAVTIGIIAIAWFLIPRFHFVAIPFVLAAALAIQLIFATGAEARRTRAAAKSHPE
jgi:hypothetical protein